jgi:hypothetical protein
MNKAYCLLASTLAASLLQTAACAADVGVSINVAQPGFYGRIDIGNVPSPVVIYPQPMIIEQHPVAVIRQPIYLRVPPGHEKHWAKYCKRYGACGQPVFFVQDNWYRDVYTPRMIEERGRRDGRDGRDGRDQGHDNGHGKKFKKEHGGD